MQKLTRPPLRDVPLFLRCPRCDGPFRAVGSFVERRLVPCAWCGRLLALRPVDAVPPAHPDQCAD